MLALHFINGSVDPVDFITNEFGKEDLSFNEMETIAEIVAEQILDIENCFPEYDEPYEEENIPVEQTKQLNQYLPVNALILSKAIPDNWKQARNYSVQFLNSQFSPEIVPPPPKMVV